MRHARHALFTIAGLAALASLPGCGILGSSNSPSGRTGREVDSSVPKNAAVVKEGEGDLEYTAGSDGTIFVQDSKTDAVIVKRKVARGDRVRVHFDDDYVRVNDETVYDRNLERDHAYKIYLLRDGRGSDRVPTSATLVGEGANKEINYRADRDGTVYVYDAGQKKVVGSASIRDGQRFQLSPGIDRATVDGDSVDVGELDTRSLYRVYFDRD